MAQVSTSFMPPWFRIPPALFCHGLGFYQLYVCQGLCFCQLYVCQGLCFYQLYVCQGLCFYQLYVCQGLGIHNLYCARVQEEFGDAKGVIRIRISKKNRQHTVKNKYKRTDNGLQSIHIKLKMRKGRESAYDKWSISVIICDTGYYQLNIARIQVSTSFIPPESVLALYRKGLGFYQLYVTMFQVLISLMSQGPRFLLQLYIARVQVSTSYMSPGSRFLPALCRKGLGSTIALYRQGLCFYQLYVTMFQVLTSFMSQGPRFLLQLYIARVQVSTSYVTRFQVLTSFMSQGPRFLLQLYIDRTWVLNHQLYFARTLVSTNIIKVRCLLHPFSKNKISLTTH